MNIVYAGSSRGTDTINDKLWNKTIFRSPGVQRHTAGCGLEGGRGHRRGTRRDR